MAFARLFVYGFLALSVIYLAISIYSRSLRREKLEKAWAEDHPGDDDSLEREAHIEAGMAAYKTSLRRKLIALVYVIPTIVVLAIAIIVNVL